MLSRLSTASLSLLGSTRHYLPNSHQNYFIFIRYYNPHEHGVISLPVKLANTWPLNSAFNCRGCVCFGSESQLLYVGRYYFGRGSMLQ